MGSIAQLKAECRVLDFDVRRGSGINKQRKPQHKLQHHEFQIHEDASEQQLIHELRSTQEREFIKMSSTLGSPGSSDDDADQGLPQSPMQALQS